MGNFALPPTSGGRAFRTFALTALHTASGTASQVLQSLTLGLILPVSNFSFPSQASSPLFLQAALRK